MFDPYDYPRAYETEAIARLAAQLAPKPRRVARSYVRNVQYGEMTLGEWQENGPHSVKDASWRKPYSKGGNYYGTEADSPESPFRKYLHALIVGEERWRNEEEVRAVRKAQRTYRMNAPAAADTHVKLMDYPDPMVRLRAAKEVADRADPGTAVKSDVRVHQLSSDDFAAMRAQARVEAAELEEEALDAWTPAGN